MNIENLTPEQMEYLIAQVRKKEANEREMAEREEQIDKMNAILKLISGGQHEYQVIRCDGKRYYDHVGYGKEIHILPSKYVLYGGSKGPLREVLNELLRSLDLYLILSVNYDFSTYQYNGKNVEEIYWDNVHGFGFEKIRRMKNFLRAFTYGQYKHDMEDYSNLIIMDEHVVSILEGLRIAIDE